MVKNSDKGKYVYSRYGIRFDSGGPWSFDNDFAWNVVILGVDNSSSSHSEDQKDNFLILGEGPTYGINRSVESREKKLVLILLEFNNTKFFLNLHYKLDDSYWFVNEK